MTPWGSGPARAHNCHVCGRRIGLHAGHVVNPAAAVVICTRCAWQPSRHADWYPDCDNLEHRFVFDHHPCSATRAGAWHVLARAS